MNNLPAGPVLPGMRIHRQNGLPGAPIGPEPIPADTPARRHRWRPRRRGDRGNARHAAGAGTPPGQTAASESAAGETAASETAASETAASESAAGESAAVQTAPGETVAAAVQLVIGLLTASLDSPGLEAWAVEALTPHDPDGMGNFMAGLHLVSQILLHELYEATGEPPEAVMQRLAFLAEHWRESSSG
jgi:hypothetical protein